MWICLSTSIRNLVYMLPSQDLRAQLIYTQLEMDGFSWIPNLTIPDASLILPVMLTVINLSIIEVRHYSLKS